jgi:non-ribosomal peptide synthetase component E (peptide arylation enzyme)
MGVWREEKTEALLHMIQMGGKRLDSKKAVEPCMRKVVVEQLELVFRMFEEVERPNWMRSC